MQNSKQYIIFIHTIPNDLSNTMAINTYSDLRVFLKKQFDANWEYKIGVTELLQLSENITNGSNLDPLLKRRAEMLLADQRDTPFICFNTEAVAFGLLKGRELSGRNTPSYHMINILVILSKIMILYSVRMYSCVRIIRSNILWSHFVASI